MVTRLCGGEGRLFDSRTRRAYVGPVRLRGSLGALAAFSVVALLPQTASAWIGFSEAPGSPFTTLSAGDPDQVSRPMDVGSADFDGDGNVDLVVANDYAQTLTVHLGEGTGGFAPHASIPFADPGRLAVDDVNGDGDPDLAVTSPGSDQVSVLLGGADATFGPPTAHAVGDNPWAVSLADVNQDDDPDLIVANLSSNDVSVLAGGAGGSFSPAARPAAGLMPSDIAAADFDGDDQVDLAIANLWADTVSLLRGAGDATFTDAGTAATGDAPRGLAAGDFDGDGDPDLAVAFAGEEKVEVRTGGAGMGFNPAGELPIGDVERKFSSGDNPPLTVRAVDLTSDGDPDLVTGNEAGNFSVFKGRPEADFAAERSWFFPGEYYYPYGRGNLWALAFADFDADGRTDVALQDSAYDRAAVMLNGSLPQVDYVRGSEFGAVPVGTQQIRELEVTNDGAAPLRVTAMEVSPGEFNPSRPGEFTQLTEECTGREVPVGESCTVNVRFAPQVAGPRSAGLVITSNATSLPSARSLSGTGIEVANPRPAAPKAPARKAVGAKPPPLPKCLKVGRARRGSLTLSCAVKMASSSRGRRVRIIGSGRAIASGRVVKVGRRSVTLRVGPPKRRLKGKLELRLYRSRGRLRAPLLKTPVLFP